MHTDVLYAAPCTWLERCSSGSLDKTASLQLQSGQQRPCLRARPALSRCRARMAAEPQKLWGGRFTGAVDPLMEKFNESLPFDKRLWREDLQVRAHALPSHTHALHSYRAALCRSGKGAAQACAQLLGHPCAIRALESLVLCMQGSKAYAKALAKVDILTQEEADTLERGLTDVGNEWEAGTFEIKAGDEDIHTANERRLTELVGAIGGKLHTGRYEFCPAGLTRHVLPRAVCCTLLAGLLWCVETSLLSI